MGSGLTIDWALAWVDPVTHESTTLADHNVFMSPSVSPNGSTIVFKRCL